MKKIATIFVLSFILSIGAIAEGIEDILPDASIWGISSDVFQGIYKADFEKCQVGEDEAWRISNVDVCSFDMDVYYVFEGASGGGLSKIAYIQNASNFDAESEQNLCLQTLIEEVKKIEGEPNSIKNSTNIWKSDKYKIELGKGKLSKYTGSDNAAVAIIFKEGNHPKPTKAPKPTKKPQSANDEPSQFTGTMIKVQIGGKTVEIHKSFKDSMDKYEDFFDKYIRFLKDPDIFRYSEMMIEYSETMEALEKMGEEELSTGELAYYTEVHARIISKLSTLE